MRGRKHRINDWYACMQELSKQLQCGMHTSFDPPTHWDRIYYIWTGNLTSDDLLVLTFENIDHCMASTISQS